MDSLEFYSIFLTRRKTMINIGSDTLLNIPLGYVTLKLGWKSNRVPMTRNFYFFIKC